MTITISQETVDKAEERRIDRLFSDLSAEMRRIRFERGQLKEAAGFEAAAYRKRIKELETSRANLKAVVVALAERLVRLETRLEIRMASAGEVAPPGRHVYRPSGAGTSGQKGPANLDYPGNPF